MDVCSAGADALSKLSEQGKVKISDLNVVDVLVLAEYRESIRPAIPEIIDLLSHEELDVCEVAADALSKLSEHGKTSNFLTRTLLM